MKLVLKIALGVIIALIALFVGCSLLLSYGAYKVAGDLDASNEDIDPMLKKASNFVTNFTYNKKYNINDNFTLAECISDVMYNVERETTKLVEFDNIYGESRGEDIYRISINYKKGDSDVYFTFDTNLRDVYAVNNNADEILKKLDYIYEEGYNELNVWSECKDNNYKKENPERCDGKINSKYCFLGDSFIY